MRLAVALTCCVILALVGAGVRDGWDAWVDRTDLPLLDPEVSTEVRDRNGKLLRSYTVENGRWRLLAGQADVDPVYLEMLIAYEDQRFYRHNGVDGWALLRAGWQMLREGEVVSGGSTLTMQVARLMENGRTGTWSGKLRQMRVAWALERRLTKSRILDLYLMHAPFGGNLEGVRAGSLAWLGKEPARLLPEDAALLVALPQAPEARRPDRNPRAATDARDRVLRRTGFERRADARRVPDAAYAFPLLAPHLADRARAALPDAQRHDLTLDAALQSRLETLVADAARRSGARLSAALLVADHRSGEILASVGSPGLLAEPGRRGGHVDMTRAIRSPGSTVKPLVYGLAFDAGLVHPETLMSDRPVSFGRFAPQNFDGQFRGPVTVRRALENSLNIPVVELADALGPARIMVALDQAGADPRLPGGAPGLAIALGGLGLSMEGLTELYAMIAQGGQGPALRWRMAVDQPDARPRVLSRGAAWQVADILAGVPPPPGGQAGLAYKTGTSYGHRDAWAVGFDGAHVIAVWLGRADGTPVPGAFGGDLAAPLLFEAFGRLSPRLASLPPAPPEVLTVGSGQLPLPLQRFRGRFAAFDAPADAPVLHFPPNGAKVDIPDKRLVIKLREGRPPFTVLRNGAPVATRQRGREITLNNMRRGPARLSVVDARGMADSVSVVLD